jgi:hypothetical protein
MPVRAIGICSPKQLQEWKQSPQENEDSFPDLFIVDILSSLSSCHSMLLSGSSLPKPFGHEGHGA